MLPFDVIILAGGLGTRLKSVVNNKQKVFAPVNGVPFITFVLKWLKIYDVKRVTLALGHLAQSAIEELPIIEKITGVECSPVIEPMRLGTGGGAIFALPHCGHREHVLIMNGDSLLPLNLTNFWLQHQTTQAAMSIAGVWVDNIARYGHLEIQENSTRLNQFVEKNNLDVGGYINGGMYLIRKDVLKHFPHAKNFSMETELIPHVLNNAPVHVFKTSVGFIDIGLPETWQAAQRVADKLIKNLQKDKLNAQF